MGEFLSERADFVIVFAFLLMVTILGVLGITGENRVKQACYEALASGANVICDNYLEVRLERDE